MENMTLDQVQKIIPHASAWKVIDSLFQKGLINVYENLNEKYKPKKEKYLTVHEKYQKEIELKNLLDKYDAKPHYQNIILTVLYLQKATGYASQKELIAKTQASNAQIKYLSEKGILKIKYIDTDRVVFTHTPQMVKNILSSEQNFAYHEIKESLKKNKPVLLHGVTGSGKSHVYFQLIKDSIDNGKQALYLLPEIALTTQIVQKLKSIFGNQVGIYHSRFSNAERVELWKKVQLGTFSIVIGSRSSLFLPFKNLGLIIIDEEHDTSYKQQDPAPRYHARDAAAYLAYSNKAQLVMGSATPSIESYFNTLNGKYTLVTLQNRYGNALLPNIEIVDLKNEHSQGTLRKGIFSLKLVKEIQQSLEAKKQVILFQNRRGYSPYIQCEMCGWVPQCAQCDISLTFHKTNDKLQCHYCNSQSNLIHTCDACGSNKLSAKSFGTEKIEEVIQIIFPNARVERFDYDSLKIKNKFIDIINRFEKREIDILVGTQMLVKGLDFAHVNLVGVLSADRLLSYPDFRVHERAFQLIEQVAGRAGRKEGIGKVIIQLFNTTHPLLKCIQSHDYLMFFESEIKMRKEFLYPPYTKLIRVTFKHKDAQTVKKAAQLFYDKIKSLPRTVFFGPAEPQINRIKNYYLQELLLKTNKDTSHLREVKSFITQELQLLNTIRGFGNVYSTVDVDP